MNFRDTTRERLAGLMSLQIDKNKSGDFQFGDRRFDRLRSFQAKTATSTVAGNEEISSR
jgi:hypothetical protein